MRVKEIERRFLLKRVPIVKWTKIYDIVQYYIRDSATGVTKRLRVRYDVLHDNERTFEYLHKINLGVGEFMEVHEAFDPKEYKQLKSQAFKTISKRRYLYEHNGLKFEIDVIDGINLVLMEVELDNMKQDIVFPDEIKCEVMTEVTGINGLSNFELASSLPIVDESFVG